MCILCGEYAKIKWNPLELQMPGMMQSVMPGMMMSHMSQAAMQPTVPVSLIPFFVQFLKPLLAFVVVHSLLPSIRKLEFRFSIYFSLQWGFVWLFNNYKNKSFVFSSLLKFLLLYLLFLTLHLLEFGRNHCDLGLLNSQFSLKL